MKAGEMHKAFWLKKNLCRMLPCLSQLSFAEDEIQYRVFRYETPGFITCGKYLKKQSNGLRFQEESAPRSQSSKKYHCRTPNVHLCCAVPPNLTLQVCKFLVHVPRR